MDDLFDTQIKVISIHTRRWREYIIFIFFFGFNARNYITTAVIIFSVVSISDVGFS
jgi:hypothetical protein